MLLWSEIVDPKDERLKAIASIIEENAGKGINTFAFVNNHYEESTPLSIQKLLKFL